MVNNNNKILILLSNMLLKQQKTHNCQKNQSKKYQEKIIFKASYTILK